MRCKPDGKLWQPNSTYTIKGEKLLLASATFNQTLMAVYQVPTGVTGYMLDFGAALNRAGSANADIDLFSMPFGEVFQIKHTTGLDNAGTSSFLHNFMAPMADEFTEKSIIRMDSGAVANNTDISAHFSLLLVTN